MPSRPLDPKVHFIVGILIAGFSAYTLLFTTVPNTAVMKLFLYIGLGFIALAFIKLGIRYVKSGKMSKDEEKIATKISGVPQSNTEKSNEEYQRQMQRQAQLQQKQSQPSITGCKLCGTRNYATSNYCHMCGYKLK